MLTYDDCLGLCDCTEGEIKAIARHERLTGLAAIEYAEYLLNTDDGEQRICDILVDEIRHAEANQDPKAMAELLGVLDHYLLAHPACADGCPDTL